MVKKGERGFGIGRRVGEVEKGTCVGEMGSWRVEERGEGRERNQEVETWRW